MQKKIVFIGVDLHKPLNESFSKQVHTLINWFGRKINYKVVSLEYEKKPIYEDNFIIIKKARRLFQFVSLFFQIKKLIKEGYRNFHFFMVPSTRIHRALISYINSKKCRTIITLTKKEQKYKNNCENASVIINNFDECYNSEKSIFLWPPTEIAEKSLKYADKKENIAISTCSFRKKYMEDRGIITLIKTFKRLPDFELYLLCRGEEVRKEIEKRIEKESIQNIRVFGNVKIADYLKKAKILFNLYKANSPEIPLSGVEGLTYGCFLVSFDNVLGRIAEKNGLGKIIKDKGEIFEIIDSIKDKQLGKKISSVFKRIIKKSNKRQYYEIYQ